MGRSIGDSITALFRALFSPFTSNSATRSTRVASTKMSNSRQKALETPEHLKEKHAQALAKANEPESDEFRELTTEEEVTKKLRSRADMSQYRLAALMKELPPDKQIEESPAE